MILLPQPPECWNYRHATPLRDAFYLKKARTGGHGSSGKALKGMSSILSTAKNKIKEASQW
jgi:hypothetical protein